MRSMAQLKTLHMPSENRAMDADAQFTGDANATYKKGVSSHLSQCELDNFSLVF